MINDTSQRSIATWFRYGGTFDNSFITNLHLVKLWGKIGYFKRPCAPGHCPAERWRT